MEILGRARKSLRISKNSGNTSPIFEELKRFMKLLENFGNSSKWFCKIFEKSSEIFEKLWKWFKNNFQMFFYDFLKIFEKSLEIFRSVQKYSEIFRKPLKQFKRGFQMFLWFFKIFGKSSEIFRKFLDVIGNVCNGSQELKSFGAGFWEVLKWTPVNCCMQVITGK